MQFSANLGFLWKDRSLPDAIRAAKSAGFDAVECHWPYDTPSHEVKAALEETGMKQAAWRTDPERSGAGGCIGDIGTDMGLTVDANIRLLAIFNGIRRSPQLF